MINENSNCHCFFHIKTYPFWSVQCKIAIRTRVWIVDWYILHTTQHKGRPPDGARGQSLQEMLMGESVRAVQILSLGWDLQQLAMEKKHKENEAVLILTQHPLDPVHPHTHKELATEKQRTQGWSTHTQLPAKSHKPLSTQTGSQMKALAAHKSPVTARCLPCVCRVMDSPNQMMLEDTCDSKWSTIDSSGENDLQLTSFDYLPFSSPFFNWAPLNSLLSSKFGLLGRGKSGKWAVKTI